MSMPRKFGLRTRLSVSTVMAGGILGWGGTADAQALPGNATIPAESPSSPVFRVDGLATLPGLLNPSVGTRLDVDLTDSAIINWNSYNIGAANTVSYNDAVPGGPNMAVLNRVTGAGSSSIEGVLRSDSNISVYLINPNGILFGTGANVDVGALIASTLDLTNADFNDGDFTLGNGSINFSGANTSTAGVTINGGTIVANGAAGGLGQLVLLGAFVNAAGGTQASDNMGDRGDVAFIAGTDIVVSRPMNSPLSFTISQGTRVASAITANGTVSGRNVTLAFASQGTFTDALLIGNSGLITATTAMATDRGVVLAAGTSASGVTVAPAGMTNDTGGTANITLDGTLTASDGGTADNTANVEVRARDSISGAGSITAADAVDLLSVNGGVTNTGTVQSGTSTTISGAGTVDMRDITAIAGNISVTGGAVTLQDSAYDALGASIVVSGPATAAGSSTLDAGGAISFDGTIDGGGDLTLGSVAGTTFNGAVGVGTRVGMLIVNGPASLNAGTIAATGIDLDALTIGAGAPAAVALDAGTGTLQVSGTIASETADANDLSLTGSSISVADVGVGGRLASVDFNSATTLSGDVDVQNEAIFDAELTLSGAGVRTVTAGSASFQATESTTDGGTGLAANVAGLTDFNGAVGATNRPASLATDAGGTTSIDGGSVRTTGAQTYGDLLALGTSATLAGATGTFDAALDGNASDLILSFSGAVDISGGFSDLGDLSIIGDGVDFAGQTLAATNDITLDATNAGTTSGALAGGAVTGGNNVTATGGSVDIDSATATAGALSLTATAGDVALDGGSAGTSASFTAAPGAGNDVVTGDVGAGIDIAISAGGAVTIGPLNAGDDIAIRAGGLVTTAALSSGLMTDQAGSADTLVAMEAMPPSLAGSDIDIAGDGIVLGGLAEGNGAGSDVRLDGAAGGIGDGAQDLSLDAGGAIILAGDARGRDVALNAGTTISTQAITARDDIAVRATDAATLGALTSGATVDSLVATDTDATGSVDVLLGALTSGNDIDVAANGLLIGAASAGGTGSDIRMSGGAGGIGAGGQDLDLDSDAGIALTSAARGRDIALDAGGTIVTQTLNARDDIAVRAVGAATLGAMTSGTTVDTLPAIDTDATGAADALLGGLTPGNDIDAAADGLVLDGPARANGSGSDIRLAGGAGGTGSGAQDIDLGAGASIAITGAARGRDVALNAGLTIVTDAVSARDDIATSAVGAATLGALTSGTTVDTLAAVDTDATGAADALLGGLTPGNDIDAAANGLMLVGPAQANGANSDIRLNGGAGGIGSNAQGLDLASGGDIILSGAVTLSGASDVDAGGAVTFNNMVDGANDLTIDSAAGTTFNGAVGGDVPLGQLTVNGPATLDAASLSATGIDLDSLAIGPNAGAAVAVDAGSGALQVAGDIGAATPDANALSLTGSTISVGNVGVSGRLGSVDFNNATTLNGDVNVANAAVFDAALTLGGTGVRQVSADSASFQQLSQGTADGLSVDVTGAAAFNGAVGVMGGGELDGLALDAGSVTFGSTSNYVGTLAANIDAGGLSFTTVPTLTVGTVDGLAGVTTGAGDIALTSGGGVGLTQAITANGGGNVTLDADGGSITGSGMVAGNDVALESSTGIGASGARVNTAATRLAAAGGSGGVFMSEADGVTLQTLGAVANGAASAYDLTAAGAIIVSSSISTTTGDVVLAANGASSDLAVNANITAGGGGDIRLTAGDDLGTDVSPTLVARDIFLTGDDFFGGIFGSARLQETRDVTITDTAGSLSIGALTDLSAVSELSITTIAGELSVGGVSAGSAISLLSATNLTLTDNIDAGAGPVSLVAGGPMGANAGFIDQTGGVITAGTLTGSATGSAVLDGDNQVTSLNVFTADNFALNDVGGLTVTGVVDGGAGGVSIMTSGDLDLNNAISSTGTVNLAATGASSTIEQMAAGMISAGTLTGSSTGATSLATAGNEIGSLGAFSANGFALNDGGGLTVTGIVSGGAGGVSLATSGALVVNNAVSSTGTVNLQATGASGTIGQSVDGVITAGTLTASSDGATDLTAAANKVGTLGTSSSGGAFSLDNDQALTTSGTLTSGDAAALTTTTGGLTLGGDIAATGQTVTLTSAAGITQTGAITAATLTGSATNAALLTGANQVANLGAFSANGITLNDGGGLTVTGPVAGGAGGVTLITSGNLGVNDTVSSSGTVNLQATGIGSTIAQTLAGVITAGTLTTSSTGATTLTAAANKVGTLGTSSSGGAFSLDNDQALTTSGTLTSGGAAALTTTTGGLTLGGDIAATGQTVMLTSAAGITQTGAITAATLTGSAVDAALLTGANQVANLGAFSANGFALNDGGGLTVTGIVNGGAGGVSLATSGALVVNNAVSAAGTVNLQATGASGTIGQSVDGVITAGTLTASSGGATDLTAAANKVGTLGTSSSGGAFSLDNDQALTTSGTLSSGGAVALATTTGGLTLGGDIAATGQTVTLTSAAGITQTGAITAATLTGSATNAALLTGANQVANLGSFSANGFTLNDGGGLRVTGAVTGGAGGVTLITSGDLGVNDTVSSTGTVNLQVTGTASAIDQSMAGVITAGTLTTSSTGATTLTAAANKVGTLGTSSSGAAFSLDNDQALTTSGTLTSGGAAALTTTTGGLTLGGDIAATGQTVTLTSAAGITQTGAITAATLTGSAVDAALLTGANQVANLGAFSANGLTLNDGGGLTVTGIVNGGAGGVSLATSGALVVNNAVSSTGTVNLQATGASGTIGQSVDGVITAGTLTASSDGATDLTAAANKVGTLGTSSSGGAFSLDNDQALTTSGTLTSGDAAALTTTTGGLTLGGDIAATGQTVMLTSAAGITQTGAITAATLTGSATNAALLTGANQVANLGSFSANGFTLNDGGGLTVTGPVAGGAGGVTLITSGNLGVNDTVSSSGTVNLQATGIGSTIAQTLAGVITAGTLTTSSTGATTLTAAANKVGTLGTSSSGGAFSLDNDQALTTSGTLTSGGAAALTTTTGGLTLGGDIAATGQTVTLTSAAGITQTGAITAATLTGSAVDAAQLTGANQIADLGAFSAGRLTFDDGGGLRVTGAVTGTTGIEIDSSGTLTVADTGSLATADSGIDLATTSGDIIFNGAVDAGTGIVRLTSAGAIRQDGAGVISAGALTGSSVGATALADAANAITSLGTFGSSNFALNDVGGLTVTGAVTGTSGIEIDTAGMLTVAGTGSLATGTPVTGSRDIDLATSSGGGMSFNGAVNAGTGIVTLTSAGTIDQNGNGVITADRLTGSSVGGTDLDNAANMIATLGLFGNTGSGGFALRDAGGSLIVAGPVNAGGALALLVEGGALTLGDSSLSGDQASLTATGVTQGSGGTVNAGSGTILIDGNDGAIDLAGLLTTMNDGPAAVAIIDAGDVTLGNITARNTTTGAMGALTLGAAGVDNIAGNLSQTALTAITVGTLVGNVGGSATLANAANAIASLGAFTANGLSVRDSADGLTVSGPVNAGNGDFSLRLDSGALTLAGDLTAATGTINLDILDGAITQTGGRIAAATLRGESVGGTSLNSTANAIGVLAGFTNTGSGGISLVDSVALTVTADVDAGPGSLSLTSVGLTFRNQTLSADGDVTLDATTGTLEGNIASAGAALTVSGNSIDVTEATANAGPLMMTADAGSLTLGTGSSGGAALLSATEDVTVTSLSSAETSTVTAGSDAGDAATIAMIESTGADIIVSGAGLSIAEADAAGAIDLDATLEQLTLGSGTAGATASLTKLGGSGELQATTLNTGGDAAIASSTSARLGTVAASNGSVQVMAAGEVTGIGAGTPRADLTAGGADNDVTVSAGTLARLGALTASDAVTVTADAVDVTTATASNGALTLAADAGDLRLVTGTAGSTANLDASAVATVTSLTAGGNVTIDAGALADLTTIRSTGGNVTVNAASIDADAATVDIGALAMTASAGQLTLGTGTVGTTAMLTKLGGMGELQATRLNSGRNATITSSTNARLGDVVASNGTVQVSASSGQVTGLDPAVGRANLTAGGTGNDVTVTGGTLARLGNVMGADAVTATADAINIINATATNGALTLNADAGNVTFGTGTAGTTADLDASGNATVGSLTSGGSMTIDAGTLADLTMVRSTGGNIAVNAASIDAETASADVGALAMSAGAGQLTLGTGTAGATAMLSKLGNTGELQVTTLRSGTSATLASSTNARLGDVTATNGTLQVAAASGQITGLDSAAGRANLTAGGTSNDLIVTGGTLALLGNVTGADAVTVTADTVDITNAVATAGALTLNADAGNLTLGTGTAGTTADLDASANATVASLIAGGDVVIDTGVLADLTTIRSTGGNVAVNAASIDAGTMIANVGSLAMTASAGQLALDTGAAGTTAMLTKLGSTGELQATTLNSGRNATITSSTNARLGDVVASNGTVQIAASGQVTGLDPSSGRANLTAGGTGNDVTVTGGTLARLGNVAGSDAVSVIADAIDITNAAATSGALTLTADAGNLTLGTGTAGTTADLDASANATVGSLTSGGNMMIDSGALADLTTIRSTGGNLTVNGASIDAVAVTADVGSLAMTSGSGQLTLGTGAAGTTVTLTKLGSTGELQATTLNSGTSATIASSTNARLGDVVASDGNVQVTAASGQVTGLDAAAGRANLTAGGTGNDVTATGGTLARLGNVASADAVTITADVVDITNAVATAGSLTLTADSGNLTLGTGTAGTTADLDASADATVGSLTSGGNMIIDAGAIADLTTIRSTGGNVTVNAASLEADTVTANLGSLAMTAGAGQLTLGTAAAGTTGSLTKNGAAGELQAATLDAGANIAIASSTNARLGDIASAAGDVGVTAAGEVTGIGADGRGNLTATSDAGDVAVVSGTLTRLDTVIAGNDLRATSGNPALAGSIDIVDAAARTGLMALTAFNGDVRLGTGSAATMSTLTTNSGGDVIVTDSLVSGGDIAIGSGDDTDMLLVRSSGGNVSITAADAAGAGPVEAAGALDVDGASVGVGTATAGTSLRMLARTGQLSLGTGQAGTTAVLTKTGAAGRLEATTLSAGGDATVGSSTDTVLGLLESGGAITVDTAGNTQAGTLTAARQIDIDSGSAGVGTAGAGTDLTMLARAGQFTLDTGTAGAAATLTKHGAVGELQVTTSLTAAGDAVLTSSTSQRLGTVTSNTGDITLAATQGSVTGVAAGGDFGAADLAADGNVQLRAGSAGLVRLSDASATRGGVDIEAGTTAVATSRVEVLDTVAAAGAYSVTAGSIALGDDGGAEAQRAGGAVALTATSGAITGGSGLTLQSNGDGSGGEAVTLAANGAGGAIAFAADSQILGGTANGSDVTLDTVGAATLGQVTATGSTIAISANNLELQGAGPTDLAPRLTAATVNITNRGDIAAETRLGDGPAGAAGFDLTQAEVNRIAATGVTIESGTQNVQIGALALATGVGSTRLNIQTTGRVDVTGTVSANGSAATRTIQLGGNAADGAGQTDGRRASVIRVAATAAGGGRLLMGDANLDLRGGRIGIGQDADLLPATGADFDTVANEFIANPNSSLYNAAGAFSAPTILTANTLSVTYTDFALFQNTAQPLFVPTGAIIGALAVNGVLNLTSTGATAPNGFAIFGEITGRTGSEAALLGPSALVLNAVNPSNTRINGCVIGGGGCLVNSVSAPTTNIFDLSQLNILRSAEDLGIEFDPVIGTNNEALFSGLGSIDPGFDSIDCEADPSLPECSVTEGE